MLCRNEKLMRQLNKLGRIMVLRKRKKGPWHFHLQYSTNVGQRCAPKGKQSFKEMWKTVVRQDYIKRIMNIFGEQNFPPRRNGGEARGRPYPCYFVLGAEGVGKKFFIHKAKDMFLRRQPHVGSESNGNPPRGGNQNGVSHRVKLHGGNDATGRSIFFEYDFKDINQNESVIPFSVKLHKLDEFLRHRLMKEINSDVANGRINMSDIYEQFILGERVNEREDPLFAKFPILFKHILNTPQMYDYLNDQDRKDIARWINLLEMTNYKYDDFLSFLSILLRKLNVKCFIRQLNQFSAFLYFLKMLAECEEYQYCMDNSEGILTDFSSGLFLYRYFLSLINFLRKTYGYNFCFVFYNLHCFLLGPQPARNFHFFAKWCEENVDRHNVPVIFHSIKNIEMMKFVFVFNNLVLKQVARVGSGGSDRSAHEEKSPQNGNPMGQSHFPTNFHDAGKELQNYHLIREHLIEINDLSYDMVRCLIIPNYVKDEKVVKCIYDIIGGNAHLVKTICEGLHDLNSQFDEDEMRKKIEMEKKQNVTYDMDEESQINLRSNTIEEIVQHRKLEQQKGFLKNIHENILHTFILDFERKVRTFFSLPNVERLKRRGNDTHRGGVQQVEGETPKEGLTYIQFYFTIFEAIKYFLKKKKIFCKNILNLNNPILLGLIDVNIIQYNYEHGYLELTNQLYEVLLINYMDMKYRQFPLKYRAQYNINYVLNYKIIQHEFNLLESQA
ncbi:hypothetical protein C922_03357 [Plasmodium inui San Antonio 1]|uniref:Uncharacterized protein n=1 Tax=Plasmodium inui San Antonio 1 TaxID=1237626 RepID=W6ZZ48_9APIC|nr:hypothetical protein C922_03357 [Plasmodium inui San Antonio 1]EUD66162.1 hypothetical protein C922_03357 [Plasmodium inui San Antonio 1]